MISLCWGSHGFTTPFFFAVPTTVAPHFVQSPAAHFVQQLATGRFDVQGLAETAAWHGEPMGPQLLRRTDEPMMSMRRAKLR